MTETDTYLISRMRDELVLQNKKLAAIAEQLEAQTKLQAGIFKQLYLLCQMTSKDTLAGKFKVARKSEEVFVDTPIPEEKFDEN